MYDEIRVRIGVNGDVESTPINKGFKGPNSITRWIVKLLDIDNRTFDRFDRSTLWVQRKRRTGRLQLQALSTNQFYCPRAQLQSSMGVQHWENNVKH